MNDKYNPIDITWEDFETYLPDYQFDEKQIQFFKDTLEMILHNRNTSKVTCFGTRCGIGKSTMIHTLENGSQNLVTTIIIEILRIM